MKRKSIKLLKYKVYNIIKHKDDRKCMFRIYPCRKEISTYARDYANNVMYKVGACVGACVSLYNRRSFKVLDVRSPVDTADNFSRRANRSRITIIKCPSEAKWRPLVTLGDLREETNLLQIHWESERTRLCSVIARGSPRYKETTPPSPRGATTTRKSGYAK